MNVLLIASCLLLVPALLSATTPTPSSKRIKKPLKSRHYHHKYEFHYDLAEGYGRISDPAFKYMDRNLKIIIGHTISELSNLPDHRWKYILQDMNNNTLIKKNVSSEIFKKDEITYKSHMISLKDGHDKPLIQKVVGWYKDFIGDSEIIDETKQELDYITEMLDKRNVGFHNFKTLLRNTHIERKRIIDSGVLRIPDITYPHFVLYRVKLSGSITIKRTLVFVTKRTHVKAEYHRIVYDLTPNEVAKLSKKAQAKAVEEAEDAFSHLLPP